MKESRFTDEPIIVALQEWEAGATIADLVRPSTRL